MQDRAQNRQRSTIYARFQEDTNMYDEIPLESALNILAFATGYIKEVSLHSKITVNCHPDIYTNIYVHQPTSFV